MNDLDELAHRIVDLYERKSATWASRRGRSPALERSWLERFAGGLPAGATVLDLGAGDGWPIAAELLRRDLRVVGVDAAPSLIRMAKASLPDAEWHVGDMRKFADRRSYDGVIAWHSLFHLQPQEQAAMFPRFAELIAPSGRLMFTSGPRRGVVIGDWDGEPLYHSSLAPEEYRTLLRSNAFELLEWTEDDPQCGHATIWLAARR